MQGWDDTILQARKNQNGRINVGEKKEKAFYSALMGMYPFSVFYFLFF